MCVRLALAGRRRSEIEKPRDLASVPGPPPPFRTRVLIMRRRQTFECSPFFECLPPTLALALTERGRPGTEGTEDLGRRRIELKVWRRTERGLQMEEERLVFSNIKVRVKRAGPSGLGDLEVTE